MGMYVPRSSLQGDSGNTKDLNQGDVLQRLPLPKAPLGKGITTLKGPKITFPFAAAHFVEALATPESQRMLRVILEVDVVDFAIVLSNACDNTDGSWQLLVAPVTNFQFSAEADTDGKRWRQISAAATGSTSPKNFYMPAFGGMPRAKVELAKITPVTHEYVQRCVLDAGTDRSFGLAAEAQRHLQRTLDFFFARNAREDYDWPSREDLLLKRAWLEESVAAGGKRQASNKAELEALSRRLENWQEE